MRADFGPMLALLLEIVFFHRKLLWGAMVIPWDMRAYHLPLALFFTKALRDGELPLWNPMNYCGYPFAANVQTALYYPPRVIAMLLGGTLANTMLYSLEIDSLCHILLAGIGCYFLMREFGWSRAICAAGATSFQLGGFFASQLEHLGAIEGMAWLPVIWLLLIRLAKRVTPIRMLLLGACLAMPVLSGFSPVTAVVFLSSGLFAMALVIARQARIGLLPAYFGCCVIAAVLSSAVLLPSGQLVLASVSRYRSDWLGNGGGLPLRSLLSLVWPNIDRVLQRGLYRGKVDPTLMYLYSGSVILLGSLLFLLKRKFLEFPAVLLTLLVSALFMLGESTPFGKLYGAMIPATVRGAFYPQEWIGPFSLAFCLTGVAGLAAVPRSRWMPIALAAIAIVDLTWFGSNRPFNSVDPAVEPGVTERAFAGSEQLLETVRALTETTNPPSRIDTVQDALDWVGSNPTTGIPTAGGADPMAPIRAIQVRLAFTPGERWGYYYQATNIRSPVLGALNVCCILSRSHFTPEQLSKSDYSIEHEVPGGFLYESKTALPRFYLVHRTLPAKGLAQAADFLDQPDWRPKEAAIVEGWTGQLSGMAETLNDRVAVLSYRRNSVRLETDSAAPSFLASSETNYPGWKARVDGQPAPIYTTNVAFRGLPLPAGKHRVDFDFDPGIVKWSFALSVAAWAVFAVLLAGKLRAIVLLH